MKIAMCMYGKVGGTAGQDGVGDTIDLEECHRSLNKRIFRKNPPIDIFAHSWSIECKDRILAAYNPVAYVIEPQIIFDENIKVQKFKSRWYSTKSVISLKSEHERKNGFVYDCVCTMRYDVIFHRPLVFGDYDMRYFWASVLCPIDEFDVGKKDRPYLQDFWFFSNSKTIDLLGGIFDNPESRNSHKAAYMHMAGKCEIRSTMEGAKDYDLYRWYTKTDPNWPRKWYANVEGR